MQPLIETIKQNKTAFLLGLAIVILLLFPLVTLVRGIHTDPEMISPLARNAQPTEAQFPTATPSATLTPTDMPLETPTTSPDAFPTETPTDTPVPTIDSSYDATGAASYYSSSGCVGCSKGQTMADGETLNDDNFTIASNDLPLGTRVQVTNVTTGSYTYATVTDRGGFTSLGRIADLSVAVKNAIGCSSMCTVRINE